MITFLVKYKNNDNGLLKFPFQSLPTNIIEQLFIASIHFNCDDTPETFGVI